MDGAAEDDAGAEAALDGATSGGACQVPLVARASVASTLASSVAISRTLLKSPFAAAAPRVAMTAAGPTAFAVDKAPLLDKKDKAGPTGRVAHYTGRMTIYVLVVALVSATGGMLFG